MNAGALRILVVHSALGWRENEGGEIADLIAGLRQRVTAAGGQVLATNGRGVFRVDADGDDVTFVRVAGGSALLRLPLDVAHVHMVTQVRHLLVALLLRLRGVPVVCSPMAMLGDDFAASSWFRAPGAVRRLTKPMLVRALRGCWKLAATLFVCTSAHEARQARLAPARVVLLPLPLPRSALARWAVTLDDGAPPPPDAPAAYVGRFDVHRKGIDRLAAWLRSTPGPGDAGGTAALPTPALRLFAPGDRPPPPAVAELISDGVIDWDTETSGADLAGQLRRCRALMLLTRYEGQPRVLREAALLGVPIITTVAGNFTEAITALDAGVVVDADRPEEVQAAYARVGRLRPSRAAAARLLDRSRLGAFLYDVLDDVAAGRDGAVDYYTWSVTDHGDAGIRIQGGVHG